ncbi:MAG: methyltransferase domain-containing protein [Anaerolineae bacterium]|nr:methyltransferase domain-containing protein [Anaerolineae bacterium]
MHDSVAQQYQTSANLDARIALHARFSVNPYPWMRWVFDHLTLPPVCRVLELGAGTGSLWLSNQDRIPEGWDITLSDLSPGMLAQARAALSAVAHPFAFEVVDAQAIPYEDGAFDAVIANHMLYHVPDLPRALAELRRVLKPGGTLFASTVGERAMAELWALVEPFRPGLWERVCALTANFNLENGATQLAAYFKSINRYDYVDGLIVTEIEPLLAYILSSQTLQKQPLSQAERLALQSEIAARITAEGAIRITKTAGVFVARKNCDNRDSHALFSSRYSANPCPWQRWLFEYLMSLPSTCRVLDVGVGLGLLWAENRDRIPEGWDITVSDFSLGVLNLMRFSFAFGPCPLTFAVLDAQAIPYADDTFDVVIANHMLCFVTDVQRALAEIRRVLKPDGVLFAATTGELHLDELWEIVDPFRPGVRAKEHAGVRPFSLENGAMHLSTYFKRVERFDYVDSFRVPRVKPLVDFVYKPYPLSPEEEAALSAEFAARIAAEGAFHITKAWGLFVAQNSII